MATRTPIPQAEIKSGWAALKAQGGWPLAAVLIVVIASWMFADVIDAWEANIRADTDAAQRVLRLIESGQYVPAP